MQHQKDHTKKQEHLEGVIGVSPRGEGLFYDEHRNAIVIERNHLNTALHNDVVRIVVSGTKGNMRYGKVEKVLTRTKSEFVGTVIKEGSACFVEPTERRMYTNIALLPRDAKGIQPGEKVLVSITKWADPLKEPLGKIIERIGKSGEHETEMKAIVLDKGFWLRFPEPVRIEAYKIKEEYPTLLAEEKTRRRTFFDIPTFTIDPADAKDFDDALSFATLPNGNFEIAIHIADVSAFLKEKSDLDIEGSRRATSIYLVDRTIPMLPPVLSDDLCSLNEGEEKLTFSVILEMTPDAHIVKKSFEKTVIKSNKRFNYEEAQHILDTGEGIFVKELATLNTLAKKMRDRRAERGAIDFGDEEVKFDLDKNGFPLGVHRKERGDTHKLIEEFMILANAEVAEFMTSKDPNIEQTFVYRVHDLPKEEKLNELLNLLSALGHSVPKKKASFTAKDVQRILKMVEGETHEHLVQMAALQSMAKAIYSTNNIGHFGLSLKYYTHFTSPIRRYPDIMVHRLLWDFLQKKQVPKKELGVYEALSRYATQMEIAATDAERASIKFKQTEYMSKHVGEIINGTISGVTEYGVYVRDDETLAEGMMRLRDLRDDFYVYKKEAYSIIGEKTKRKFTLGDKLKVKVARVNVEKRFIDYIPA